MTGCDEDGLTGDDLASEVVADYVLRLRAELDPKRLNVKGLVPSAFMSR